MKFLKEFKEIKGDASFRKFYRNKKNKSIIVYSKKEKNKNLLIYDAVNKILIKNKILAPKLISQNYKKDYIEIEDLGKKTIFQILKEKKLNNYIIMTKVLRILKKIQLIKDKKINNFQNKSYKIKEYKKKILFNETRLFCEWYVPRKLSQKKIKDFNLKLQKEISFLISKLNYKNNTFVHRDFHVSNLVYNKDVIGLIDNQDALIGNKAYDLASLIDDVRFRTSIQFKKRLFEHYLKINKNIKLDKFKNDFEILSVLRNLKIIGIFTRLAYRDKKNRYLKLIPYAWEMIFFRMKYNGVFKNLVLLLSKNFPAVRVKL
jgi:aminoglycoside/choline kinase family phosphotransferase